MIKSRRLVLYIVLLSTYTMISMSMHNRQEQQSIDQECIFDMLPLELQEHIMSYVPVNNVYRALWLRCHEASQKLYNALVQVYLESHCVPKEFIDKAIAQDFATVCSKVAGKQEFQEKIKRALEYYGQSDTELINSYQEKIKLERLQDNWNSALADMPLVKHVLWVMTSNIDEYRNRDLLQGILMRFKGDGRLIHFKKLLQKHHAYLTHCKALLYKTHKAVWKDRVYKLDTWLTRLSTSAKCGWIGTGAVSFGFIIYYMLRITAPKNYGQSKLLEFNEFFNELFDDPLEQIALWLIIGGLTIVATPLCADFNREIISYVCDTFMPYYRYILMLENLIEDRQKRVSCVLDVIDQIERI